MTPTTGAIDPRAVDAQPIDLARVVVSGHAAASLIDQLERCEEFLRTASDAVRNELRAFLASQPNRPGRRRPDMGWLIDMLGFNALYLRGKTALAIDHPGGPTSGHKNRHHSGGTA